MPKCRVCGGYASEGKPLCPFDQIRHGKFDKGKWIVDWNAGAGRPVQPPPLAEMIQQDLLKEEPNGR